MSGLIWWEKTVEYRFLQELFLEKANICPLDGNEELVGDAITFINSKWSLIEFKKSCEELKTEKNKYNDYEKAQKKLAGKSDHHHFVYGGVKESKFTLFQKNYWEKNNTLSKSQLKPESANIASKVLNSGVEIDEFLEYILRLLFFKKQKSKSCFSIWGRSENSYVSLSVNRTKLINFVNLYITMNPQKKENKKLSVLLENISIKNDVNIKSKSIVEPNQKSTPKKGNSIS